MSSSPPLRRVMLLDDEAVDQLMYKRIIKRSGLVQEVIGFTYAQDALDYLLDPESPKVDLVLLDINMPRMSGFDFLEAAAKGFGGDFDTPVVMMLTTSLNPRDQERAAQFRAVRSYLNKPLKVEDIEAAVEILRNTGEVADTQIGNG